MSEYSELLKPCPECGSEEVEPLQVLGTGAASWQVVCNECGHEGEERLSFKKAAKRWNEVGR